MAKMFWQMNTTVDSFMEGPNQELDYTALTDDPDFAGYVQQMIRSIDHIVMGRKTHDALASFWPTSDLPETPFMNELPKTVFSAALKSSAWSNTKIAGSDLRAEIEKIKKASKKDVAIFGSANLGSQLMELGLVDELRIFVCPFVLGKGQPMFQKISHPTRLKLKKAEQMSSGMVSLFYDLEN